MRKQINEREGFRDGDFCRALGISGRFAVLNCVIRRAVESHCRIAPEKLRVNDSMEILSELTLSGWDVVDIIIRIEEALDVEIDESEFELPQITKSPLPGLFRGSTPREFGDWSLAATHALADYLELRGSPPDRSV
jgi:acyl carrier protein